MEFLNSRLPSQAYKKEMNGVEQHIYGNTNQNESIYNNVDACGNVEEENHYMSYSNNVNLTEEQYAPLNTTPSVDDNYRALEQPSQSNQDETYQALNNNVTSLSSDHEQDNQEVLYGNIISDNSLYGNIPNSKLR